jgi:hypothetical protein
MISESLSEGLALDENNAFETMQPRVRSFSFELDDSVQHGDYLSIRPAVESEGPVPDSVLRVVFYNPMHSLIAEWNSRRIGQQIDLKSGTDEIAVRLGPLPFKTAAYQLGIVLSDSTGGRLLIWSYKVHSVNLQSFTRVGPDVALGIPAKIH